MNSRSIRIFSTPLIALLVLCACASDFAIYEPPTLGRLSTITFVNAADSQDASLVTFVDGTHCTGRRQIQFEGEGAIPAGSSRTITAAAGREFTLFVRLASIASDEYGVDIGMTGGGPAPAIRRTVTAIGCSANLSFDAEPENDYHIVISEPTSSASCSVVVSKNGHEGGLVTVESTPRIIQSPRNKTGAFCQPLVE